MKIKILITLVALIISGTMVFAQSNTRSDKKQLSGTTTELQKDSVYYTCPMHPAVKLNKPGKCPTCGMTLEKMKMNKTGTMEAVKTYTCPMHPEVISDKPGKCPKCGMDLKEKKIK